MDTSKIKIVLAAAKYKSLSRAADEFSYTPSALSHMLSSFEESLGVRIFDRSSVGVELTEEGRLLVPKFKAIIESEDSLLDAVSQLNESKKYVLRLATYSSISRNVLSGLLKGFRKENPNIKITVNVADDLTGWIENDRADIVFADSKVLEKNEWFPIMEDKYFAIAPKEWFPDRESIGIDELYDHPHIYTDDLYLRDYFEESRFKELIYFRSEDDLSVINMVKEGMGTAVLPALVLKETIVDIKVLALDTPITRTIGFGYKKQRARSFAFNKFTNYIKNEA